MAKSVLGCYFCVGKYAVLLCTIFHPDLNPVFFLSFNYNLCARKVATMGLSGAGRCASASATALLAAACLGALVCRAVEIAQVSALLVAATAAVFLALPASSIRIVKSPGAEATWTAGGQVSAAAAVTLTAFCIFDEWIHPILCCLRRRLATTALVTGANLVSAYRFSCDRAGRGPHGPVDRHPCSTRASINSELRLAIPAAIAAAPFDVGTPLRLHPSWLLFGTLTWVTRRLTIYSTTQDLASNRAVH